MKPLSRLINAINTPVIAEWPFVLLATLLTGSSSHWVLHSFPSVQCSYLSSWAIRFGAGFMLAYVCAIIICIIPQKWLRRVLRGLITGVGALLFLAEGVAFGLWKLHISPALITLVAETNRREITATCDILLSSAIFWEGVIVTSSLIAAYLIACRLQSRINKAVAQKLSAVKIKWLPRLMLSLFAVTMIASGIIAAVRFCGIYRAKTIGALATWVVESHEQQEHCDNISRLLFAVRSLSLAKKETLGWSRMQHDFINRGTATTTASDSLNVVCIIGESFIRSHSSLYGYPLSTNPCLERLANSTAGDTLLCFSDMATATPRTSESLRAIFSVIPYDHRRNWHETVSFPAVFCRAGFDVNMADNQLTNASSHWAFSLSAVIAHPVLRRECYSAFYVPDHPVYDLEFADSAMATCQRSQAVKTLDIIHLAGQHLWADFPHEPQWERFSPPDVPNPERQWLDNERLQRIADYDNATIYNDSVVSRIINRFRNREAVVLYFPDHGEEVFDYRDAALRKKPDAGDEQRYIDHVFRIPFFVWMSESYIRKHPETAAQMANAVNRPGSLAHVAHTLLHLGQIATPLYNPALDILSSTYNPPPRTTTCGIPVPAQQPIDQQVR